jgi:hypothetical protein
MMEKVARLETGTVSAPGTVYTVMKFYIENKYRYRNVGTVPGT